MLVFFPRGAFYSGTALRATNMRKTKIIATLGPATDSPEMIGQLMDAGMNIARLNMSHATHDWVRRIVPLLRQSAEERHMIVGILMDTQGPAIRTGDLPVPLHLTPGQKFTLTVRGEKNEELHSVDVNYENFINDISVGDVVLVDNGEIHMKVLAKHDNKVECEVLTEGELGSRRHINLPGVKVSLPPLTDKDRADVALGLELKVDFISLSFTREASDLRELKQIVRESDSNPLVLAKIEDQEAIRNLDEIIEESDGIMVARGDLGIEVPYEELPIIQRRIVKACLLQGRPVIVATHMLESMIDSPMPTRAEVTDVCNAVFEQADAIMLSGETTVGKYPVKCIEVFDRIAVRTELSGGAEFHREAELTNPRQRLAKSAVLMADEFRADAVIVLTRYGRLAHTAAWMRPRQSNILALTDNPQVAAGLTLARGVTPIVMPFAKDPEETIEGALAKLARMKLIEKGHTVIILGVITSGDQFVDALQVRTVK
jgi:pyruvate kinase